MVIIINVEYKKKIILGDNFIPSTTKKIKSTYKDELENKVEILLTTYRGIKEKLIIVKIFTITMSHLNTHCRWEICV